jgi:DMATS type aromatic prenyltransferase
MARQKVPFLGPAPRSHGLPIKWKCQMQLDGTPFEYSWKWNTQTSEPDVRYTLEPIGQYAGTELDPLNQLANREVLHNLAGALPGVDLTWFNHFLSTLFDHDNAKYAKDAAAGAALSTSMLLTVELLRKRTLLKSYFYPRKLGQVGLMPVEQWEAAIRQLDPDNAARAALHEFLANNPEGKLLNPFDLSVDNVDPAKSRLKWYFNSPHTSFASVREIMTLGGRVTTPHQAKQFTALFDLNKALAGLPSDFPENSEVPASPLIDPSVQDNFDELPMLLNGNVYFFDIAPGKTLPEMKLYLPVRNYGRDDESVGRSLTGWMEAHGRGQYCERYMKMLESLANYRNLSDAAGVQTFVSVQFKNNGELDLTTYLAPEAFHPGRLTPRRRGTRRRGGD